MYDIQFTERAYQEFLWFTKRAQKIIRDGIESNLRNEPIMVARNRKPLRPNNTAKWELRIQEFRVLYDVDDKVKIVEIQRVGKKERNRFLFRGKEGKL